MLGLAARMAAKMAAKKMGKQAAKEADEIPRYTQSKSFKALEKAQKNSGPEAVIRDMEKAGAVALGSGFAGAAGKSSLEDKEAESESSYKRGGKVSSASKRADGCAIKGKTKGRMV
jgi:hypothetical protein